MQALRLSDEKKKFYGTICKIAIPVILQNMITMGVNLMDTVMLGSYGEVQLSGSSLANDFINIFHKCQYEIRIKKSFFSISPIISRQFLPKNIYTVCKMGYNSYTCDYVH